MTTLELLTIPGMDNSKKLLDMQKKSRDRMRDAAVSQMVAAALMSSWGKKTSKNS